MKNIIKCFVLGICTLSICSCSTTAMVRKATMEFPLDKTIKETSDAITYVLNENGFEIKTINDTYGIIDTEWKKIKYSNIALSIFAGATTGSAANYDRYIKLDFKINEKSYTVIPHEKQGSHVTSMWGASSNNEREIEINQDSDEGKNRVSIT